MSTAPAATSFAIFARGEYSVVVRSTALSTAVFIISETTTKTMDMNSIAISILVSSKKSEANSIATAKI